MVSTDEEQAARTAVVDATWQAFKDNPGWSTYKAWVRSGYVNYADSIEAQDLGVGSDVRLLADAAADKTQQVALDQLKGAMDFTVNIVGPELLGVVRGLGSAIVDGIDSAYDTVRGKLRGREPDVIAAVTVGLLTVLSVAYLWNAAKRGTMTYQE